MTFRFVHTADVHLDSPLSTLALRDPMLDELIGGATRTRLPTVKAYSGRAIHGVSFDPVISVDCATVAGNPLFYRVRIVMFNS